MVVITLKFFVDVTVLTTHTQNNPLVETFKIDRGIITYAGIFYPNGCHGLVYAKLFYQAHQILPRNQESWCHGNNGWWEEQASMVVDSSPMKVKIVAFALNTLFNHIITVCVEVVPFGEQPRWNELISYLSGFASALGLEEELSEEAE